MVLRVSPNFEDTNRIREFVESGVTDAETIGRNLGIKADGVQRHLDSIGIEEPKPKAKRKRAPKAKAEVAPPPEKEDEAP